MLLQQLKILLGEAANNYDDALLELCIKMAMVEVEEYCNRDVDISLELIVLQIAKIKANRINTEGLTNQSFSGVGETYLDGYPAEIKAVLNRKRRVKVI